MSENEWGSQADKINKSSKTSRPANPKLQKVSKNLGRPNDYPNRSLKDGSIKRVGIKLELETIALIQQAITTSGSYPSFSQNRLVNYAVQQLFGEEALKKVRKELLKNGRLQPEHLNKKPKNRST